jgi:dTDP-4-dehydrorhamnose reductase
MMRTMAESQIDILGTVRSGKSKALFSGSIAEHLVVAPDLQDAEYTASLLRETSPDVVINCVSPNRESIRRGEPLAIIPICALLPHQLSTACEAVGARLVHISTDGVFSGARGAYTEADTADATDMYGMAKRLGEVSGLHTITLRTSVIGHELRGGGGLLEWFLSQRDRCKCFSRAVFSGLPTIVMAEIVRDFVLPRLELSGVYHVAAQPITKCDLLHLIAEVYGKKIEIVSDEGPAIDRSLNSDRFRAATGYVAPDWPTLITTMHASRNTD